MRHPKKYNTTPEISKRMSNIGLRRNKPERTLAKALWKKGFRYRLNYKELPGSPDIAITKYRSYNGRVICDTTNRGGKYEI